MVSFIFSLKVESRMVLIVPLVVCSSSSSVLARDMLYWRRDSSCARQISNADDCWVIGSVAWINQDTFAISVLCTQMYQVWFAGSSVQDRENLLVTEVTFRDAQCGREHG